MPITSLHGTPDEVYESFFYAMNKIALRRGVYSQEQFAPVVKHGMELMVSNEIVAFMEVKEAALRYFMGKKRLAYVILELLDSQNDETVELWVFHITNDDGSDIIETLNAEERFKSTMMFVDAKIDESGALDRPCIFKVFINLEQFDGSPDDLYEIFDYHHAGPDDIVILEGNEE